MRIHSLDGLRAASILLVLIGHVAGTVNAPLWLTPLHNLGNFGVKLFFVISGFLITYLLLEEKKISGNINLTQFYLRRSFRIFPAFYCYIFCIVIAEYFGWINLMPDDVFHAATYTMNYHHERAWALNHTWSLAVEEQFYLLWPFLLLLLGNKHAFTFVIGFIFLGPFIRAGMWFANDTDVSALTREFQAVADALASGCLLAFLRHRGIEPPNWLLSKWFFVIATSFFIIPALLYKIEPFLFYSIGQSVANIMAVLIVWHCISMGKGLLFTCLNHPFSIWLGTLSYSLYLWQEPFLNSWSVSWFASWPINIVLAFLFAIMSFYFVERPCLRIKAKLAQSHSAPAKTNKPFVKQNHLL